MDRRGATPADRAPIPSRTKDAREASYSRRPATIATAAEEGDGPDEGTATVDDDDVILLVAATDEGVGVAERVRSPGRGQGGVRWRHVHPEHRGHGSGSDRFEHTRDRRLEVGVQDSRGRVLADNHMGAAFSAQRGVERAGRERTDIDGEQYREDRCLLPDVDADAPGPYCEPLAGACDRHAEASGRPEHGVTPDRHGAVDES